MVRAEFSRFVDALSGAAAVTADEWRFINLISDNLEALVPLGTSAGKRAKYLVSVAYPGFAGVSVQPPSTSLGASAPARKLIQLNALTVGPFRGFGVPQDFDLSSQVTLLYGPNGTGKSSFCEALEYCLLGTVNDCSAKRISVREYLKNARTQSFESPTLLGCYVGAGPEPIIADEDVYRFCFVEKNRIDDFSRIASFTPAQQEKLIAALFGIGEFDAFVSNFNESIQPYLQQSSTAISELASLEKALISHRELAANKPLLLKALAEEEALLADSYESGISYPTFVQSIGGHETGIIKSLTDRLSLPVKIKTGVLRSVLSDAMGSVWTAWSRRAELQGEKEAKAKDISYRDLYTAVLTVESNDPTVCPACDTPLVGSTSVVSNPFQKARRALDALAELADIEGRLESGTRHLVTRANGLLAQLSNIERHLTEDERNSKWGGVLREVLAVGRSDPASEWWNPICGVAEGSVPESLEFLTNCVLRMEQEDELSALEDGQREGVRRELGRIT